MAVVYASYGQLGVVQGMSRELPFLRGAGQCNRREEEIEKAAFTGSAIAGGAGAFVLTGLFSRQLAAPALIATLVYMLAYQFHVFAEANLRAKQLFGRFSAYQFIVGGCLLGGSALLLLSSNIATVLGIQAFAFLVGIAIIMPGTGLHLRAKFNLSEWKNLVRPGYVILIASAGFQILRTIDRWVLLTVEGYGSVGVYSFQVRILSFSLLFAGLVATQFYPRMAQKYGETRTIHSIIPLLKQQVFGTLILTALASIALLVVFPPLVRLFWPEYIQGLRYFPILLAGSVFLPQTLGLGQVLVVTNRQWEYVRCMAVSIIVGLGLMVGLTSSSLGAIGTAIGAATTNLIYLIILTFRTRRIIRDEAEMSLSSGHNEMQR